MIPLFAALFGLAAAPATGCVQKNASHCANLDGDATCAAGLVCSKCTSENDGCVGTVEAECAVGGGSETTDTTTAATTEASTTEFASSSSSASGEEEDASSSSSGGPEPFCGDGAKNGAEICEGDDLGGAGCTDLGFVGGMLACNEACQFDFSACTGMTTCGDGMIDGEEQCDAPDFGGETCETYMGPGFSEGELSCNELGCFIDPTDCCKPNEAGCSADWQCCSGSCKLLTCGLL